MSATPELVPKVVSFNHNYVKVGWLKYGGSLTITVNGVDTTIQKDDYGLVTGHCTKIQAQGEDKKKVTYVATKGGSLSEKQAVTIKYEDLKQQGKLILVARDCVENAFFFEIARQGRSLGDMASE